MAEFDRRTLVAALRERGVDYLAPSDAESAQPLDDPSLLAGLAGNSDPRLRQALIALFLLDPRLAPLAPVLRRRLDSGAARELSFYYTAAVYLQRMWRIRLGHYLESVQDLPDLFSAELGLPRPEELHGKAGLHALAELHKSSSPLPSNPLSEYEGVVDTSRSSWLMERFCPRSFSAIRDTVVSTSTFLSCQNIAARLLQTGPSSTAKPKQA